MCRLQWVWNGTRNVSKGRTGLHALGLDGNKDAKCVADQPSPRVLIFSRPNDPWQDFGPACASDCAKPMEKPTAADVPCDWHSCLSFRNCAVIQRLRAVDRVVHYFTRIRGTPRQSFARCDPTRQGC